MALSKDCQDKLKGNEEYNYKKIFYLNRTVKNLEEKARLDVALSKHRSYIFIVLNEVIVWH